MRRLSRRLALWGGAAAIAGGGFAFMNSNAVAKTGAGEGSGSVSGYNVTDIIYNNGSGSGCGGTTGCYLSSVQFRLTSTTTTSGSEAYATAPSYVRAAVTNAGGTFLDGAQCVATSGWASGTGTYSCTFPTITTTGYKGAHGPKVKKVAHLDVTATQ